jgi:peptidoglycan hydrolase-like protein with peptidoglycan-binding domain
MLETNVQTTRAATAYPGSLTSVGSRGEIVSQIQTCLNNVSARYPSIPRISVDGVFGQATRGAVTAFQQAFHLTVDGADVIIGLYPISQ